jgi:hypothetical protein
MKRADEDLKMTDVEEVEAFKKAGARYFIIQDIEELSRNSDLHDYLFTRYRILSTPYPKSILFSLEEASAATPGATLMNSSDYQ